MSTDVEYQTITSASTEEIVELYQAGGWWRESPENRQRIAPMIRGSFCFLVATLPGGPLIAMGRVISDGASDAYIQDVVVLPEYRGRGIGRELIRRLTARCVEAGIGWIGLIAEPGRSGFYEGLGYGKMEGYDPMLFGKRG
jgi:aralkylamine N-acetyltransferase